MAVEGKYDFWINFTRKSYNQHWDQIWVYLSITPWMFHRYFHESPWVQLENVFFHPHLYMS